MYCITVFTGTEAGCRIGGSVREVMPRGRCIWQLRQKEQELEIILFNFHDNSKLQDDHSVY